MYASGAFPMLYASRSACSAWFVSSSPAMPGPPCTPLRRQQWSSPHRCALLARRGGRWRRQAIGGDGAADRPSGGGRLSFPDERLRRRPGARHHNARSVPRSTRRPLEDSALDAPTLATPEARCPLQSPPCRMAWPSPPPVRYPDVGEVKAMPAKTILTLLFLASLGVVATVGLRALPRHSMPNCRATAKCS